MSEYRKWLFSKIDLPSENFTKSFMLKLEKSAQEGDHESQFKIGYCYQYGLCVRKSISKAFEWYTQAAEAYIPGALCNLGGFYLLGIATKENIPRAFELYKKAAELGDVIAQSVLAELYMQANNNTNAAIYWWEQAAEQNHPNSITWLASAYKKGIGNIKQDYQKARELYEKAARLGSSIASDNLGCFYLDGSGVSYSLSQARYWFEQAIEQGSSDAKYHLATTYFPDTDFDFLFNPKRILERRAKGIKLLKEAAEENVIPAINLLIEIYNSNPTERQYIEISWLQKIIKRNMKGGNRSTLGHIYRSAHAGIFNINDNKNTFY